VSGFLTTLLNDYATELERYRNRPFLKATMAACALAASASGEISFAERIRIDQILMTLDALKVFDPHDGVDLFNEYAQRILDAPRVGREHALTAVRTVATDPAKAALLVRICLAVAEARGEKGLIEQIEIVILCSLLKVDPGVVGLYTDHSPSDILDS